MRVGRIQIAHESSLSLSCESGSKEDSYIDKMVGSMVGARALVLLLPLLEAADMFGRVMMAVVVIVMVVICCLCCFSLLVV